MRRLVVDLKGRIPSEAGVIAVFCLWTAVPLLVLLSGRGVFNGAYGFDVPDVMQYMAFIRESGQHLLISNQFDVVADRRLFLDPVFALSGGLWRLGASIQLSELVWVPVTTVALIVGFAAYARRLLGIGTASLAAALTLAFFYLAPATAVSSWLGLNSTLQFGTKVVGEEMFAGAYTWSGGPALAIALMPLFLLGVERLLELSGPVARRCLSPGALLTGLAGALTMWLHPWQGLTLLVIVAGLLAWDRDRRRYGVLALPVLLTLAPLGYFFVLSHIHSSWMEVSRPNDYAHFGWWLVLSVLPLALALPGVPGRHLDSQERILRLWPVAAVVVYLALDRTWFYHAFDGLSLPLAILAVKGWQRLRLPRSLGVAAAVVLTVPGLVWVVQQLVATRRQHFFTPGEARALAFIDRQPRAGPVLAPPMPLGEAIPAFTGRQTYVGHPYWTPSYPSRTVIVQALFAGRLAKSQAAALITSSRAAFLAHGCIGAHADLRKQLPGLIVRAWKFGCATVYEVAPTVLHAQIVAPGRRGRGAVT